jgi:hypothetical protein
MNKPKTISRLTDTLPQPTLAFFDYNDNIYPSFPIVLNC